MEHLQIAVPVLASLNIDKTVKFYQSKLGFDRVGYQDKDYAVVCRDKIEIHFWRCTSKIHPENTSCYVRVRGVDGLYEEMKKAGVVHPNGLIKNQPYRIREFAILDEDGNMIKFEENI